MILLRPSRQVRRAEAKKGQPSRSQHACNVTQNSGVLFARDVDDGVVGAYGVEGPISEWQRHQIGTNPERCRDVASCEAELHLRKVDANDMGTSSEPLGDGDTGSATSIEDTRPRWQAAEKIVQQRDIPPNRADGTRDTLPRCDCMCLGLAF